MCVHCYKKAKQAGDELEEREKAVEEAAQQAAIAQRQVIDIFAIRVAMLLSVY